MMHKLAAEYHDLLRSKVSPGTYRTDKYILPEFIRYLTEKGVNSICSIPPGTIEGWLGYLQRMRKNSAATMARKVNRLNSFFHWLCESGYILCSPIPTDFFRTRVIHKLRPVPSRREAMSILGQSDQSIRFPLRNRAIIELCYSTGLRRAELGSLNVTDVRGEEIRVIGKGNKERAVPMGRQAKRYITAYLKGERLAVIQRHNPLEEALFIGHGGNRLSLNSYNDIMRTQVRSPFGLHSFRHACATHMLANGANIRVLQKLLGHEKLSTTQRYTRVEVSSLKEVLKKFHPRG